MEYRRERRRRDLLRMKARVRSLYPADEKPRQAEHLAKCSCWMSGDPRRYAKSGEQLMLAECRIAEAARSKASPALRLCRRCSGRMHLNASSKSMIRRLPKCDPAHRGRKAVANQCVRWLWVPSGGGRKGARGDEPGFRAISKHRIAL